jgi:anti-sigma regulatory factor (Ser/Thr protein kinase)
MTTRPDISIELSSNPLYLSGVREMIHSIAKRLGFSDTNCCQIALAVDEALCNVMRHGYEKRTDGRIWITLDPTLTSPNGSPGAISLRIVIEDEARQVDPSTIKSRDLADVRPGGLGVHIIKEVMDQARYERREHAGMRLTMLKTQTLPPKGEGCCCTEPPQAGPKPCR